MSIAICLIIRWKCPSCKKTYTQLPDFGLPRKRFVLPVILHYASACLNGPDITYRSLFSPDFIGYPDSDTQLSHTSVHRWLATLGSMRNTLSGAQALILQKVPDATVCRDAAGLTVHVQKYRSEKRKGLLETCLRLFFVDGVFQKTFDRSIFPRFATRVGFT